MLNFNLVFLAISVNDKHIFRVVYTHQENTGRKLNYLTDLLALKKYISLDRHFYSIQINKE